MDREEKNNLILEFNKLVQDTAAEVHKLVLERVNQGNKILDGKAKYIIYGRVIMFLFQRHFHLAYAEAGGREDEAAEYAAKKEKPHDP